MLKLANRVILASGWTRRLIALFGGAVGALAMAPVNFFPAMFVPMILAVWLIDGSTAHGSASRRSRFFSAGALKSAFGAGWWLGFGYFIGGLWWLGAAFVVASDRYAWAMPLGVLGLPAGLALFTGLGFAMARLLWSSGPWRVLALAAGLSLAEWLRGHVLSGFPWNDLGMTLGGNLVLAQFASLTGLYGLTVLTIAIFAAPATLIAVRNPGLGRGWGSAAFAPSVLALLALAGLAVYGGIRLAGDTGATVAGVSLRIMQPNVPQDDNFRAVNKEKILHHYLALSDRATSPDTPGIAGHTALIWPESAFPFILSRDPASLAEIGRALPAGTTLVTGAAREEPAAGDATQALYFNSIQVIASGGKIIDSSDKEHLVPFGEYIPFGSLIDATGIRQFVDIPGGFTPGTERKLLSVPGLPPVAPLICYEAIFPGEVLPDDGSHTRPGLLLNVTDDAWFGLTAGPYQHFSQARIRAIEEGLPLIRAANTGISAVVDPYGRVIHELPLGVDGIIDSPLPKRIESTFFERRPMIGALLLWLIVLVAALISKGRYQSSLFR